VAYDIRRGMNEIKIERTGNAYGNYSSEFRIDFPDGTFTMIWSPPFEMSDAEKDSESKEYAETLWKLWQNPNYDRELKTLYEGGELTVLDVVE
jgi:hypothetical protein